MSDIFNPLLTDERQQFQVGQVLQHSDGRWYAYVEAGGTLNAAHACRCTTEWLAAMLSNSNDSFGRRIVIPQVTIPNNHFGWGLVFGQCNLQVAANCGAYNQLYPTDDAGQLDNTQTSNGHRVFGLVIGVSQGGSDGINTFGQAHWPQLYLNT